MLVGGLSEAVSLGAVIPFLAALAAPEKVLSHPAMSAFFTILGDISIKLGFLSFHSHEAKFVIPALAAIFALATLWAAAVRLLLLWASLRLANAAGADLSLEVYRRTLYQPYLFHISNNSSALITSITSKTKSLITMLGLGLTLSISFFTVASIVAALLAINASVALIAASGLGLSYFMISWVSRKKMYENSLHMATQQTQVVKAIQEGLGGIRDVLLDGTQPAFCRIYQTADAPLRCAGASAVFIGQSPRFIMEGIAMLLFSGLALGMAYDSQGLLTALPILGALALGVQRLLPALQQGYAAWSGMLASQVPAEHVLEILDQPLRPEAYKPVSTPLPFLESIRFEAVKFRYTPKTPMILDGLSFVIPKGSRVGFVGKTGSGKSTCLDLLMGLLEPTEGQILIDGTPLTHGNLRAWQKNIAHVPQSIYLSDGSLAENIAFGVPHEKIDMFKVSDAARRALIADFIDASPKGYQALVGERGIRLSGGQRQRIGIARALYKQAQVLVFDEATSALDHETEDAVMQSIDCLDTNLTILIIAHRISTLKKCSFVIDLNKEDNPQKGSTIQKSSISDPFNHASW